MVETTNKRKRKENQMNFPKIEYKVEVYKTMVGLDVRLQSMSNDEGWACVSIIPEHDERTKAYHVVYARPCAEHEHEHEHEQSTSIAYDDDDDDDDEFVGFSF
jgi:hypothetical protein